MVKADIKDIHLVSGGIELFAVDGRLAKLSFSDFVRLKNATHSQQNDFTANTHGLRWDSLDEDISYDSIFAPEDFPLRANV